MELQEKLVFLIVGGLAASCYVALAMILHALGLSPTTSSALAYVLCMPLGYFAHRSFTFRSVRSHRHAGVAYPAVQVIALLIATALTFISADTLGLPPIVAFFLAASGAAAASYVMQKRWVF